MEPDHWGDTGTEKEESEAIRTKILIDLHHKCWIKVKLHNLFHLHPALKDLFLRQVD